MFHTYPLYNLLLCVIQLVQVSVYLTEVDVLIEMGFQILHSGHLTHWLAKSCHYKMAKGLILYLVKSHGIVNLIKNELCSIQQDGIDISQNALGHG